MPVSVPMLLLAAGVVAVPSARAVRVRRRLGPDLPAAQAGVVPAWRRTVPWWVVAPLAGAVLAVVLGSPAALLAGCVGAVLSRVAARVSARRARRQLDAGLPRLLEDLARHLRAGGSMRSGLVELAGVAEHEVLLAGVGTSLRGGDELQAVVARWAGAHGGGRGLAAAAVALGAEAGGPQARALDAVAATLRERAAVVAEGRALTAQARASASLLAVAPVLFAALGAAAQPDAAHFLLREPAGAACLVGGVALQGAGWWWMHRISEVAT